MKLNRDDTIMLVVAIALALLGEWRDLLGMSFSSGALLGGLLFKMGYEWSKSHE